MTPPAGYVCPVCGQIVPEEEANVVDAECDGIACAGTSHIIARSRATAIGERLAGIRQRADQYGGSTLEDVYWLLDTVTVLRDERARMKERLASTEDFICGQHGEPHSNCLCNAGETCGDCDV